MPENTNDFFSRLSKLGAAEKCALRRSAGVSINDANNQALAAFYRCLPYETPRWQEDRWFAVACLSLLWREQAETVYPLQTVICNMIAAQELPDSVMHRTELLLDTQWGNDDYLLTKLTRLLKMIRQKSAVCKIDFSELLNDLLYWNLQNQSVQRKWSREIFTPYTED